MPEAGGHRKGIRGDGGKQIRLLILGGSAAADVGVDHQDHALAPALMAEDGFHPGPRLHTLWGKEISDRIISNAHKED